MLTSELTSEANLKREIKSHSSCKEWLDEVKKNEETLSNQSIAALRHFRVALESAAREGNSVRMQELCEKLDDFKKDEWSLALKQSLKLDALCMALAGASSFGVICDRLKQEATVKFLVQECSNLNRYGCCGRPLYWAIDGCCYDSVAFLPLFNHQYLALPPARWNCLDDHSSHRERGIKDVNIKLLELLFDAGADVNAPFSDSEEGRRTPLRIAWDNPNYKNEAVREKVIECLIKQGARLDLFPLNFSEKNPNLQSKMEGWRKEYLQPYRAAQMTFLFGWSYPNSHPPDPIHQALPVELVVRILAFLHPKDFHPSPVYRRKP